MPERREPRRPPSEVVPANPESEPDRAWAALQAALDEERRVQDQMDQVLRDATDRSEAELRILDEYAPQLDAAMGRSRDALSAFTRAILER